MIYSGFGSRLTLAAVLLLSGGATASAQTVSDLVPLALPISLPGSYLAGRSADMNRDISAAVRYYTAAFRQDPENVTLGERLLLLELADNEITSAFSLASEVSALDAGNPMALITTAVQQIGKGDLSHIEDDLAKIRVTPLGSLTAGLIIAWTQYKLGRTNDALATIDALSGPSWYGIFKEYHRALILDAANRGDEAVASISSAYRSDSTALKVVTAYAQILARNGDRDNAAKAILDVSGDGPVQPRFRALLETIKTGGDLPPIATNAKQGVAELLYGLATAIGTDQGPELPAAYLRLAAYLNPNDEMIISGIGDIFQATDLCQEAVPVYNTVPNTSPLKDYAELQASNCLVVLGKPDDAATYAERVAAKDPTDIDAIVQLGNVYRASEQFAKAADAYSKGIDAIGTLAPADWRILYFRGVSNTMAGHWPEAEADFQKALELNPGQPQVLNYLGYSWVDRGEHLDEALKMIQDAVDQRPNDGYVVDSLGWAYYRLGRYDDAVNQLERAVLLQPGESTINDHLGDAYWKVGRKLEATFQWAHARDFNPEPGELPKILDKLEHGLANTAPETPAAAPEKHAAADPIDPTGFVAVGPGDTLWTIAARVYGDAREYTKILQANPDVKNPNLIFPGMTLTLP